MRYISSVVFHDMAIIVWLYQLTLLLPLTRIHLLFSLSRDEDTDATIKPRPTSGKSTTSSATSSSNVTNEAIGYRVWYNIEVQSSPAPPEKVIHIECCAQSAAMMEVEVSNPLPRTLTFDVTIEGIGLSGESQIALEPGRKKFYQLVFAPSSVGCSQGR